MSQLSCSHAAPDAAYPAERLQAERLSFARPFAEVWSWRPVRVVPAAGVAQAAIESLQSCVRTNPDFRITKRAWTEFGARRMCELILHELAACAQLMDTCDAGICAVTHLAASTALIGFAASSRPDRYDHVATARHGTQDSLVADRGIFYARGAVRSRRAT